MNALRLVGLLFDSASTPPRVDLDVRETVSSSAGPRDVASDYYDTMLPENKGRVVALLQATLANAASIIHEDRLAQDRLRAIAEQQRATSTGGN